MPTTGHHWLPFTQMSAHDGELRNFVRGDGTQLFDAQGHRLFDAVSSIWTTIHGHCHPRIVEAIAGQARILDHATTLGASNPVADALAARLCGLTRLDHAIFASDGASAVETAIKIALQYWQNLGQPQRTRIVRLQHSYHGDTAAAMSCSNIPLFNERFAAITFETLEFGSVDLTREDIAAVIVEPLIQAAAGMHIFARARYQALLGITPLLICDEIATGFGRTGTMFAFEQAPIHPDILCLGKGLTGGALALSATLASERVFEAFLG
ncbi:MAG TPA: aminotransferase class III-fold pyridoxal phosphate-dependent enzyme, partial [Candidatus Dormibacteraeota bacterium]|nr:aminotransferase class III-fold pyridoxal phosphate-dependent enzyme [Candidatus Dormibacteraeota bacterium]